MSSIDEFFDRYAAALLARDADALADAYAVPALILFPGRSIAVSDRQQSRDFFVASFDQYEGVVELTSEVSVLAETDHRVWAAALWTSDGSARECHVHELVRTDDDRRVAALTPFLA